MHNQEQIGDYVIGQLRPGAMWRVRIAGAEEEISAHNTRAEAKTAVKRYQAADKRRAS